MAIALGALARRRWRAAWEAWAGVSGVLTNSFPVGEAASAILPKRRVESQTMPDGQWTAVNPILAGRLAGVAPIRW